MQHDEQVRYSITEDSTEIYTGLLATQTENHLVHMNLVLDILGQGAEKLWVRKARTSLLRRSLYYSRLSSSYQSVLRDLRLRGHRCRGANDRCFGITTQRIA